MKEIQHVIKDSVGIHARPAAMLVKKAAEFSSKITVTKGDKSADARRLFALMTLAAKHGDTITLKIGGPDEEAAAASLQTFLTDYL